MATGRTYRDPCGLARALDLVGERWALLVVRELLLGPKRFGDLHRGLPGMSPNVLSQRLRELTSAGLAGRRTLGPPVGGQAYELTERGHALEPVLLELSRWGSRAPLPAATAQPAVELSVDAFALALRTTFDPVRAGDLSVRAELRPEPDVLRVEIGRGRVVVTRGPAAEPGLRLAATAGTLRAVTFGGRPVGELVRSGELRLTGDPAVAERFIACFPRPAPA